MNTAKEIAQWVIDNRYPKSEKEKVSDAEMYHELVKSIEGLQNLSNIKNCGTCKHINVSKYIAPCYHCRIDGEYLHYENITK